MTSKVPFKSPQPTVSSILDFHLAATAAAAAAVVVVVNYNVIVVQQNMTVLL